MAVVSGDNPVVAYSPTASGPTPSTGSRTSATGTSPARSGGAIASRCTPAPCGRSSSARSAAASCDVCGGALSKTKIPSTPGSPPPSGPSPSWAGRTRTLSPSLAEGVYPTAPHDHRPRHPLSLDRPHGDDRPRVHRGHPLWQVFVDPTVLNLEGRRISKSLGTGVDPLDLIAKYGSDATRFSLLSQSSRTRTSLR